MTHISDQSSFESEAKSSESTVLQSFHNVIAYTDREELKGASAAWV